MKSRHFTLQDHIDREHDARADERWGAVERDPDADEDRYPSEALEAATWVVDDEDELPPGGSRIENELKAIE